VEKKRPQFGNTIYVWEKFLGGEGEPPRKYGGGNTTLFFGEGGFCHTERKHYKKRVGGENFCGDNFLLLPNFFRDESSSIVGEKGVGGI